MGFESSRAARRRLAAMAATNKRVQEALSPSAFPGFFGDDTDESVTMSEAAPAVSANGTALHEQLDLLAHDIFATPGAGGALLVSYAAQARALSLVIEAARRSGSAPLPAAVIHAAEAALSSPSALRGLSTI